MKRQASIGTIALTAILVLANCGASSFATQLRVILSASTPLIESLNLGDKKAAVIADFADLASGAATLSDDLKACTDKPCKITAIERYEVRFWDIQRRGHFKLSPKLQNVENIVAGIIQSAKLYYGVPIKASRSSGPVPAANPAKELSDKLSELKTAMRVK